MKIRFLNICIAIALIAGGYALGHSRTTVVHAQANDATRGEHYWESSVPKTWGHVVGVAGQSLIFEDGVGTIRYYFPGSKGDHYANGPKDDPPTLDILITRK